MRILQLTHQYPPHHIGGVELITQQLARDLTLRSHDITVVTRAPGAPPDDAGLKLTHWPERSATRRFLDTFGESHSERAFEELLDTQVFDVVHVQHLMGHSARLIDAVTARGIPYIVSLHDYWYACANAQRVTNFDHTLCEGPRKSKCGRCAAARAGLGTAPGRLAGAVLAPLLHSRNARLATVLARAALVTAPSRFVIDWYAEQGYATGAWRVIPYGLDLPGAMPPSVEPETRARQFVYLGSIAWQKGVHTLIDAFNALPHDRRLLIAGPLDAYPDYTARLKTAATHPGISFIGTQTREAVWPLLAASGTLVAPSLWPETYMLVLHEALAAGCQVIASDLGAQAEAARAAGGLLFEPGNVADLRGQLLAEVENATMPAPVTPRTRMSYAIDYERAYASQLERRR